MLDLSRYRQLFVHREDVFAEQQPEGMYFPVRSPITDDDLAEHLAGLASYGSYVLRPEDQTVKFLCFDLDTHEEEAQTHLCLSVEAIVDSVQDPRLTAFECLLYETSGNKGTHVWLFFDKPIPARQARAWVSASFMPLWEEKAREHGWPLEVFPKQDYVDEGGFGNLVKLPLGRHAVSGNFSQVVPRQGWAGQISEVVPLASELVPDVGPVVHTPGQPRERIYGAGGGHAPASPFPCVDQIFNDGVGQGNRDNAMFHLALYYFGHGIPEEVALELCLEANERFDPPLSEREVRAKVRTSYRGRYQSARCGTDWLRDICPGPCRDGWRVLSTQDGDLRMAREGDTVQVEIVRRVRDGERTRVTVGHQDAQNTPTFIVGS